MGKNGGFEYRSQVGRGAGMPLLAYLKRRYDHSSEADWRSRIEAGDVLIDGERCAPGTRLRAGQLLVWRRPPWVEPAAPLAFETLHRDEHLLAVAKPAGLPVLPGAGFLENTLLYRVREIDPGAVPMHRLGRHTSGIVLFALTAEARAGVAEEFRSRRVSKRYRALAAGDPDRCEFPVAIPIGPVPHSVLGTVHGALASGRAAKSRVRVVDRRASAFVADVFIETGRPHQIRIHLAAAGHPLVAKLEECIEAANRMKTFIETTY